MLHLMKVEWKKVRVPVTAITILILATGCILSCTMYRNYAIQYDLEAWEIGTEFFSFVFPLLVVLPLCWNVFYERKDNFMLYVLPRVSEEKYLMAKWLVYAASAFFILFLPYMVSAIAALYVNPPLGEMSIAPFEHVFMNGFTKMPLLYAFLLSCWKGFIGILIMSLGFVISMYVKNIFVVLTAPFIYAILENFILAVLGLEKYRLVTAFEPSTISAAAIEPASFIVGPLLLTTIILFVGIYFRCIKKTTVVSV